MAIDTAVEQPSDGLWGAHEAVPARFRPRRMAFIVVVLVAAALDPFLFGREKPRTVPFSRELSLTDSSLPFAEATRVSLTHAIDAYHAQTALFLDVRDADDYREGHIPGAVWIPIDSLPTRLSELDSNREILIYCS